jgi:phage tail-like protein
MFSISFPGFPLDPFLVQNVNLPDTDTEQATHGDTNHDIKTAGRVKYSNIQLEKILTTSGSDTYFWDWQASCQDVILGGGLTPTLYKRIMNINELAEDGVTIINTWIATGVWPTKIKGQKQDRKSSDNTIEGVELSIDELEKL